MNVKTGAKSPRVVELDALRALAAINLMLFHFTHVYQVKYGYSQPLGFEFPWGKYGVQLFFMISGLVNALTLLKKRDAGSFLSARCVRILPCFYIVIALNLLLYSLSPLNISSNWTWPQLLANLTVMPNLLGYECLEPVMWTLQIEILFYGILLLLFLSGWLDRPLKAIGICLLISLIGCLTIDELQQIYGDQSNLIVMLAFIRQLTLLDYIPLFAVGILIHDSWQRANDEKSSKCLQAETSSCSIGLQPRLGQLWSAQTLAQTARSIIQHRANIIGIVAALTVFHCIDGHHHNPIVSVGLTVLLALCQFGKLPLLRCRPLVFISGISYMLYLLHDNLGAVFIYWLNHQVGLTPLYCFLLSLPATVILSTVSTYCLERPITGFLKSRLFGRKDRPSLVAGPIVSYSQGPSS